MKNKTLLIIGIILVAVVILIVVFGFQKQKEEAIKIGFIAPLTGPFADWGESIKNGLDLALEDTNHKFEVEYQDSACDTKETVSIARKFFDIDNIRIVIGPGCVTGLRAIAPIADEKNALLFSTGLLDDNIFEEYNSVINLATQISTEAKYMAKYMKSKGIKKVAIVYGTDYFGQEYGSRLPELLNEEEIEVTSINSSDLNTEDFRTIILKVMKGNPDVVFIYQGEFQIGLFVKQLRELGYSIPVYSYYGVEAQSVIAAGGEALEDLVYTYPYNSVEESEEKETFENRYIERYNKIPTATSHFVYDGLLLIDKALDNCDAKDTNCIKNFFTNLGEYNGISGYMLFGEDGSLTREFGIKKIENGKFIWVTKEIPLD